MPPKQALQNGLTQMWRIKYIAFAAACATASVYASASTNVTRKIANVVIEKSGQTLDSQYAEHCSKFQPTRTQVARFFSKAFPVTKRIVLHDWSSSCYAEGTIAFVDGWVWDWTLYSGGTATITWVGEETVYLYNGRNNGWFDPEACSYGGSGEDSIIPGS
jgi:hypothetical protein